MDDKFSKIKPYGIASLFLLSLLFFTSNSDLKSSELEVDEMHKLIRKIIKY